ncbi:hypothetical protein NPIL_492871 [Nephila pilipes]|uniref:Uncharacterized protein n=1 Tax=Nephila pilipes TaxID=299642 RepID=A0A8X6TG82_NEPPI|nr:hypothetical protein NPIL_492871 [Nephila pilipes]
MVLGLESFYSSPLIPLLFQERKESKYHTEKLKFINWVFGSTETNRLSLFRTVITDHRFKDISSRNVQEFSGKFLWDDGALKGLVWSFSSLLHIS